MQEINVLSIFIYINSILKITICTRNFQNDKKFSDADSLDIWIFFYIL